MLCTKVSGVVFSWVTSLSFCRRNVPDSEPGCFCCNHFLLIYRLCRHLFLWVRSFRATQFLAHEHSLVPRLIGTIIKRRSFISLYNMVVWSHLALNIAAGAYFIYTLFHQVGEDDLNNCFFSYFYDGTSQNECEEEFQIYRVVIICVYIFFCLLELCASSSLPPPQPFPTGCDRICSPIYEQVFVSSSPVTSHSLGKRRRRTIRHPLKRLRLYLRWLQRITTGETMSSLSQLGRTSRSMCELGDDA